MAIGAGMSCVKYLLFIFNLLFAITGLIILIVGVKTEIDLHPYFNLTDENFYKSAPVVLILIGVIVFIVAFFGCCGAAKENHCMIVTFSALLLIIFVAEVAVGIAGYVKRDDLETSIVRRLNDTIKEYGTNKDVTHTYDVLQTDFKCCGINGPEDWKANDIPIPESCCSAKELTGAVQGCDQTNPHFHKEGCVKNFVAALKHASLTLGGVGLGIAIVQLLGVIFACCLARSIRSQYETV